MRHVQNAHGVREFWGMSLELLALSWIVVALVGLLDACMPGLM